VPVAGANHALAVAEKAGAGLAKLLCQFDARPRQSQRQLSRPADGRLFQPLPPADVGKLIAAIGRRADRVMRQPVLLGVDTNQVFQG